MNKINRNLAEMKKVKVLHSKVYARDFDQAKGEGQFPVLSSVLRNELQLSSIFIVSSGQLSVLPHI